MAGGDGTQHGCNRAPDACCRPRRRWASIRAAAAAGGCAPGRPRGRRQHRCQPIVRVAGDTGSSAAIQTALDLTAELFNEPLARAFADAFRAAPWRRLRRWLVSPSVVLKSQSRHGGRGSWRRRALREIIRKIGRPDNAAVAERRSGRPVTLTEATASPIRLSGARETLSSNALNRSTNPTLVRVVLPASNRTAQFSASFSRSSRVSNTNGGATRLRSGRHVIWMSPHRIVGCVHVLLRIARACGIFILQARISRWIRS